MTVTQKDIAAACGVSYTTVNLVLNDKAENVNISEEMIRRVRATARKMGYIKNHHARNLVTGRAHSIGVVISGNFSRPYFSSIAEGLNQLAVAHHYDLLFLPAGKDPEVRDSCTKAIHQGKIDALALIGGPGYGVLDELQKMGLPMVTLEAPNGYDLCHTVRFDSRPGIREALEHLAELGHQHIHWLGLKLPDGKSRLHLRRQAFLGAAEKAGIEVSEFHIAHEAGYGYPGEMLQYYHRKISEEWILPEGATAIMCFNDTMAIALNYCLLKNGLQVPQDISLVGFDDMFGELCVPPLTTISHCLEEMGRKAMHILLKALRSEDVQNRTPTIETVNARLIVRQSTAETPRLMSVRNER